LVALIFLEKFKKMSIPSVKQAYYQLPYFK
jgi:hypothetical protein